MIVVNAQQQCHQQQATNKEQELEATRPEIFSEESRPTVAETRFWLALAAWTAGFWCWWFCCCFCVVGYTAPLSFSIQICGE
jgi:hypothetical protein